MRKYKDLSEEEQEIFSDEFYYQSSIDDDLEYYNEFYGDERIVWGCPFEEKAEILSNDIKESAFLYLQENKKGFLSHLKDKKMEFFVQEYFDWWLDDDRVINVQDFVKDVVTEIQRTNKDEFKKSSLEEYAKDYIQMCIDSDIYDDHL